MTAVDLDKFRLRRFVEHLAGLGEVEIHPEPIALTELSAIREGDGTLLDRMLVLAYTDSGYAKNHTTDNIPMLTAGSAGGRMKTGIHFAAPKGDPVTRVSLTLQQAIGLPVSSFGTESNRTSKTITEVMA